MIRVGLLGDTHSHLDQQLFHSFKDCDQLWHTGDVGNVQLLETLELFKPLNGVYGNIDGHEVRAIFPKDLIFMCEEVKVFITHIGGYPGKYPSSLRTKLQEIKPDLFICGHSHILKVMFDKQYNFLHINPGACGLQGWHQMKTAIRFTIDGPQIKDLEVIELGLRAKIS